MPVNVAREAGQIPAPAPGGRLARWRSMPFRRPGVVPAALITGLTILFAAIDFSAPGEINVPILYGLCIGLCVWGVPPAFLWSIAAATVALTFAGLAFGPQPIAGRIVLPLFWINRTFVAAELLILSGVVHLWIRRSERIRTLSAQLQRKNEALSAHLVQSQKMEAMGQLTAGITHDFKNIMMVIIGNLTLIAKGGEDVARRERLARSALQAAESATSLVQRLLAFSGRPAALPEPVHPDAIIRRLLSEWQQSSASSIELVIHLPLGLWSCRIDPAQFEAAILNLVVNARDAMPNGGAVTIRAENTTVGAEGAAELVPADYVLVSVSDNGPGIAPAAMAKVFDPFFTTKAPNRGSGLGLWMVRSFAEQAGGAALLDSTVGAGTRVQLFLPRATL